MEMQLLSSIHFREEFLQEIIHGSHSTCNLHIETTNNRVISGWKKKFMKNLFLFFLGCFFPTLQTGKQGPLIFLYFFIL